MRFFFWKFGDSKLCGSFADFFSNKIAVAELEKLIRLANVDSNWTTKLAIRLIGSRTGRQKFDS